MLHRHQNTPAHLYMDDTSYFITSAIYQKRPLLKTDALKRGLLDSIRSSMDVFGWTLEHWVILDNHYHIMAHSRYGVDLTELMRRLHGSSAHAIIAATHCEKPVWWNYWDYCPRDERDYLVHLNYLLYNPVKHGYVADLKEYPYSSFHNLMREMGKESLAKQFREYREFRALEVEDD